MTHYRVFDKEKDTKLIHEWFQKRNMSINVDFDALPPIGLVIMDQYNKPICLGFMIRCDNGCVINSGFLSDPDAPKNTRNEAVRHMRTVFAMQAREQGFKTMIEMTTVPELKNRLSAQGFTAMEQGLYQMGRSLWPGV